MRPLAAAAALALAAAALLPAAPLAAQSFRGQIIQQLESFTHAQAAAGFAEIPALLNGGAVIGILPARGSVILEVELDAGQEYLVAAGCDTDCENLNLRVLASDASTELAKDEGDSEVPIVRFAPRATGPYMLELTMESCREHVCYFGFKLLSRAAPAPPAAPGPPPAAPSPAASRER